ncbi:MAG: CBS domain-containing protein [Actinomycetia bacterium]|nr:CBS domain-containing protein [Actinomycetes bacterium]
MLYLSQLLGRPVLDSDGAEVGRISDLAIQTGEIFPRITSLAFLGPSKTPFMVSWRKFVAKCDGDRVELNKPGVDIRFSYLQPDELLLSRDLLNKQIVDTQGLKVVRVNDLKLSSAGQTLRLLGAEVGIRGLMRQLLPLVERLACRLAKLLRRPIDENIIAWNYMELVDRDLSSVKLSMSHKRLSELHPADVADILEQLDPRQRAAVFDHLDKQQAAETFSELEDEFQADMIDDLSEHQAAGLLAQMEPDDAADILGDLPYEKAEKLLWLMGVSDEQRIRNLLGYKEKSAGGIMTSDFVALPEETSVGEAIEHLRRLDDGHEGVHYLYTLDSEGHLAGALSLRELVLADNDTELGKLAETDLIVALPEVDQEEVVEQISKYDLLALPVVDENRNLLGIVTVDDAIDVMAEEHSEDLQIAGATSLSRDGSGLGLGGLVRWLLRKEMWFVIWAALAILLTLAGYLPILAPALIFAPLVLLVAADVVSYAFNDLLEYGSTDDAPKARQLLGRNLLASVISALVAGIFGLALLSALGTTDLAGLGSGTLASGSAASGVAANNTGGGVATLTGSGGLQDFIACGLLSAMAAILVVVLASALVTMAARRRLEADKPPAVLPMTLLMMALGLAILIGMQLLLSAHPLAWTHLIVS